MSSARRPKPHPSSNRPPGGQDSDRAIDVRCGQLLAEPWFKIAAAAGVFRETLFEIWRLELVNFYLEALLQYAQICKVLDSWRLGRRRLRCGNDSFV
jgi:hypothetical protein